jgi:hypothetical protein
MLNILNRITATGADDTTTLDFLVKTSKEFPMVEWGILVSKKHSGNPRFPSTEWILGLDHYTKGTKEPLNLSCHICGNWVKQLCFEGDISFIQELPMWIFKRIQLNFHAIIHEINEPKFIDALKKFEQSVQFIFQMDAVNNGILNVAKEAGINAVPLFDTSGGSGILPSFWPVYEGYCGYAGGLSAGNIDDQIRNIAMVADKGPIWIDAETHLRTADNHALDEYKTKLYLERASKYMVQ